MADGRLRVVGLVDLHWSGRSPLRLPDLDGVDLVLLGGDLTHFRGVEAARVIVDELRARRVAVLAVCGNCDQPEIEIYLREQAIDLDRSARLFEGAVVAGISGGLPFGDTPYERSEAEFAAAADDALRAAAKARASDPPTTAAGSALILVSHQPPLGTRCDWTRGRHVGSRAIRDAILRHQPDLVLCGHIHEAVASDTLGASRIVNPGPWFQGGALRFTVAGGRIEIE
jgi:Icc-related predicted phosphoesterase